ncbi:tRNA(His) guanylyltransferase Thg1 family protein [Chitinophaga rhizophila]|uniref:tRNA(His) guanylyltransferase n=1 Tax=Chitinophaga rhizophila TaxID=2866212 RepID=A0ABS7GCZ5_9BACT|nr:tRNA(His) guanylyltransferase Thg1 family protein [Chitinophaga rhizophila]MBW8684542.1 guanylyltransferase [Chitinophaga rhizophila]
MKFDELDSKMRIFETAHDQTVLPGMYIVARIDGRGFTKLTKEVHPFEAPFDPVFKEYMIETVKHLMNCGFNIIYGYTESDEISLLFHLQEGAFGRKHRKFNSILAGEASAKFSLLLGSLAAFDCRICELPNQSLVVDYFRWRNEDAHRNSLNAHCYWQLRKDNHTRQTATQIIEKMTTADKNELLYRYNINFNDLPSWQKRGIGVYWTEVDKEGLNHKTGEPVIIKRRQLLINEALPIRDAYNTFIHHLILQSES